MSNLSAVEDSRAWLAGLDDVQRYVAGAIVRDRRLYGDLPFRLASDDIVQEVFVDLVESAGGIRLVPIRKAQVAQATKRVLGRYRDRKYQRRKSGLPEVGDLKFEPVAETDSAAVARLAAELESDLSPSLSDEEAVIWHALTTEGKKRFATSERS